MTRVMVAAGGGGDAITARAISNALGDTEPPVILSYSWDRLLVDPLPGPRSAHEFRNLKAHGPDLLEVTATTEAIAPAGSTLPRLAAELNARVFLLDPAGGAVAMSRQIQVLTAHVGASSISLVDVGGDILTRGNEPGLRSPLADLLALAACGRSGLPCELFVTGLGVDGELDDEVMKERIGVAPRTVLRPDHWRFTADGRGSEVFTWHPSEASGLTAAAAAGLHGVVEVRDAGDQVVLDRDTPALYALDALALAGTGPASKLVDTRSLEEAAAITRDSAGICELDVERHKAATRSSGSPNLPYPAKLDELAAAARARGADFVSVRRLAECSGVHTAKGLNAFRVLLAEAKPSLFRAPFPLCDCKSPS